MDEYRVPGLRRLLERRRLKAEKEASEHQRLGRQADADERARHNARLDNVSRFVLAASTTLLAVGVIGPLFGRQIAAALSGNPQSSVPDLTDRLQNTDVWIAEGLVAILFAGLVLLQFLRKGDRRD